MGITQSFDSGFDLKTQDPLFISGVGVYTLDGLSTIVGYYVSPYGKNTSKYIYKPVTDISPMFMGKQPEPSDNPNYPTTFTKFSPGYFLANVQRAHARNEETNIEEESIKFITKNHEKNIEEVTLKIQTMLVPGDGYVFVPNPSPTTCGTNQYIKKLGLSYKMGGSDPRTYSHTCQDEPMSNTATPTSTLNNTATSTLNNTATSNDTSTSNGTTAIILGGFAALLIFVIILYFSLRSPGTDSETRYARLIAMKSRLAQQTA